MITCRLCLQALNPYVDRELSEDDVVQVREHLEACRGCLHLFRFHESLRRLVRIRCHEQQAPETLRARVLMQFSTRRRAWSSRPTPDADRG